MFFDRIKRPVSATVLVTFLSLVLQPLSVLAQDRPPVPAKRAPAKHVETGEEKYSRALNEIHEILKEAVPHAAMPHMFRSQAGAPTVPGKPGEKDLRIIGPNFRYEVEREKPLPGVDIGRKVAQLRAKAKGLEALEENVRKGFAATEKHIKDGNLPPEILARHEEAIRIYEARSAEFKVLLNNVARAADQGADVQTPLADLGAFMAKYPNEKTHTPTDPNKLPWGSPKPVERKPYTTKEQFKTSGLFDVLQQERMAKALKKHQMKLAQSGSLSGIGLPSTNLPQTPQPADLAETEDVQLTPAIRAKAAELGNKPVPIYNWVRNNIEFIPTYGSMQGADMTLQTRRGNAFDTASLLIALLRAAGVPARYVYGTIEVPAEKVMNWVGGATVSEAAQILLGQGGIPNAGIIEAGRVKWIDLEHVWIEAYVDYTPSRGAVNRRPNTWVPLDASFKQFQYTAGMDLESVAFDPATLNQMRAALTFDAQSGALTRIDQALVQSSFDNAKANLLSFVDQSHPNATARDILGSKTIVAADPSIFAGTLPYPVLAQGAKFSAIPDTLRHAISVRTYADATAKAMGIVDLSFRISLPALGYRPFNLSYDTVSPADTATLISFVQAETAIRPYLIQLRPALRLGGQVVATGAPVRMAEEQIFDVQYSSPGIEPLLHTKAVTTGSYIALVAQHPDVGLAHLQGSSARIAATKAKLEAGDFTNIKKDDFLGEILHAAGLAYWAQARAFNQMDVLRSKVLTSTLQSIGQFLVDVNVTRTFGFAFEARGGSPTTDIGIHREAVVGIDNQPSRPQAYLLSALTVLSRLEGTVWEQVVDTGTNSPRSVSAASLLAQAGHSQIPIFEVRADNADAILPQLTVSAAVKQDIAAAVSSGRIAHVPRGNLTVAGWSGVGYILRDPTTGAAAYLINGGLNGGALVDPPLFTPPPATPGEELFKGVLAAVATVETVAEVFRVSNLVPLIRIAGTLLHIVSVVHELEKYATLECFPGEELRLFLVGLFVLFLAGFTPAAGLFPFLAMEAYLYEWGGVLRLLAVEAYLHGSDCRVPNP